MRKNRKEIDQQVDRVFRTVADQILKGPKAKSWSATMPPYAYTGACPDPAYRRIGGDVSAD